MKSFKNQVNESNSGNLSIRNENLFDNDSTYSKPNRQVPMQRIETNNKLEQYYNKASGCKVRAQKDNLFDYGDALDD